MDFDDFTKVELLMEELGFIKGRLMTLTRFTMDPDSNQILYLKAKRDQLEQEIKTMKTPLYEVLNGDERN